MIRLKELIDRMIKGNITWSEYTEILKTERMSGYLFTIWQQAPDQVSEDQVDGDKIFAEIRKKIFYPYNNRPVWRYLAGYAGRSMVAFAFFLLAFFSYNYYLKPTYIIACASPDETLTLLLPDSSIVWLNNGSELCYRKDFMKDRRVFLDGEGYFSVKQSQDVPFKVSFRNAYVLVKGTEFNIKTEGDISEVTLISGRIDFGVPEKDIYIEMNPSDHLIFNTATYQLNEIRNNPQLFDWRSHVYKFSDKPLEELIGLINTMFQTTVRLDERVGGDNYFTGTIRKNESLQDILEKVCISMDLQILEKDAQLILY
ncbi:MAG: FecR family protein [Tannerellaceae bacterium]|nr:FecR family protein [Tannerellaceae bacterium]